MVDIKDLINRGQYNEALNQIEKFDENKKIDKLIFEITVLTSMGEYGQLKKIIDRAKILRKEELLPQQELNLTLTTIFAYIELYRFDEAKALLEKARIIITSQFSDENKKIEEEYAYFLTLEGWLGLFTPLPYNPQISLEKSIKYWKKLNNKAGVARALFLLSQTTDDEVFWSYLEESKNLWKQLGNEYQYSHLLCRIGSNKRTIGDINS
ncbi:MAG: hypothetical protein ACW967_07620, partial [Candidatus Hodarchaeales archaeon]